MALSSTIDGVRGGAYMELEEKVKAYKELVSKIEEFEEQKRLLSADILLLMPKEKNSIRLAGFQVRRIMRLSIKTSIEEAKLLGAVKLEEVIDKEMIKELFTTGHPVPNVSQIQFIQVSKSHVV